VEVENASQASFDEWPMRFGSEACTAGRSASKEARNFSIAFSQADFGRLREQPRRMAV